MGKKNKSGYDAEEAPEAPEPPPTKEDSDASDESEAEEVVVEKKKKEKKEKKAAPEKKKKDRDEDDEEAEAPAPKAEAPPPKPEYELVKHTDYPPMSGPAKIEYCPIDGLPPDFCQYGPSWDQSRPWCLENYPHYYPELSGVDIDAAKKKAAEAVDKSKQKQLPGGKLKRDASPTVSIKKLSRGGRKCVTSVCGLEGFGVKNDVAAKLFKKKFSCGASVVKGENGAADTVDIQGDFEQEVVEIISKEFKEIPVDKIEFLEGGTKKKGKGH
jgi:density-regulated protein DRP1